MGIDYSLFKFSKNNITKIKRKKDVTATSRTIIKKLCKYQCVLCGQKGTQIHHIVYRSEDRSKIDDIDNLILLCKKCHDKVHTNKKEWQPKLKEIRKKLNSK